MCIRDRSDIIGQQVKFMSMHRPDKITLDMKMCIRDRQGAVEIDRDILLNSQQGLETKVRYGEKIGVKFE